MVGAAALANGAAGVGGGVFRKRRRDEKPHAAAAMPGWVPSAADEIAAQGAFAPLHVAAPRGMHNLGNTCFMASVLQSCIALAPMREYFLGNHHSRSGCARGRAATGASCLACEMDEVYNSALSGSITPYTPAQFLHAWWTYDENLASYAQQDAHDFYLSMLGGLHAALTGTTPVSPLSSPTMKGTLLASEPRSPPLAGTPRVNGSLHAAEARCKCVAHRTFGGVLRSDIECRGCGTISTTFDPCLDLSLDIPAADAPVGVSLEACLQRLTQNERLGARELVWCAKCGSEQEVTKQLSVQRLPPVVSLHMKRFEHSRTTQQSLKKDTFVRFPLRGLSLVPYLASSSVAGRHGGVERVAAACPRALDGVDALFDLVAVVAHSGKLDGGHYVAYVSTREGWCRCDDAYTTRVDEATVQGCEAYMLFYMNTALCDASTPERAVSGAPAVAVQPVAGSLAPTEATAPGPQEPAAVLPPMDMEPGPPFAPLAAALAPQAASAF